MRCLLTLFHLSSVIAAEPHVAGTKTATFIKRSEEHGAIRRVAKRRPRRRVVVKNSRSSGRRYRLSEKGKANDKRQSLKLSSKLGASLRRMARGINQNPASLPSLGVFADNRDVQEHLVSTFEPWMTLENQGVHRRGDDYNTKWHIGHRIPRAVFDSANIEDMRRCWSRENVYAQCARANVENGKKLTLTDAELLQLQIGVAHCGQGPTGTKGVVLKRVLC